MRIFYKNYYCTANQLPLLFDPILSISPFFFKLTSVRSMVLFDTPTSTAISSAVFSGLPINTPNTAFSVLFIPTFLPTFVPTFCKPTFHPPYLPKIQRLSVQTKVYADQSTVLNIQTQRKSSKPFSDLLPFHAVMPHLFCYS